MYYEATQEVTKEFIDNQRLIDDLDEYINKQLIKRISEEYSFIPLLDICRAKMVKLDPNSDESIKLLKSRHIKLDDLERIRKLVSLRERGIVEYSLRVNTKDSKELKRTLQHK